MGDERLAKKALRVQRRLCEAGMECWGKGTKDTLELVGLGDLWNRQVVRNGEWVMMRVRRELEAQARAKVIGECLDKPSLSGYMTNSRLDKEWKEQQIGDMPLEARRILPAARLNVPVLAQRTNRDNRSFFACQLCKQEIGNVWLHVIYECGAVESSARNEVALQEEHVRGGSSMPIYQKADGIVSFLLKCQRWAKKRKRDPNVP